MRGSRIVMAPTVLAGALTLGLASPAAADGGAYIDLDRTHYLPGQTAVATTYVSIPRDKQRLLSTGPFYAFLVTGSRWLTEEEPIPPDAIRVGTFEVRRRGGTTFELRARLSIPDVPGDLYSIAFCNDPCTIDGFREPLTGLISIVQTEREARLLDERQRLRTEKARLRRDLRKREKELGELRSEFDAREADRAYLAQEVNRLSHELERARAAGRRSSPSAWVWLLAASAALLAASLLAVRRRRPARLRPFPIPSRS